MFSKAAILFIQPVIQLVKSQLEQFKMQKLTSYSHPLHKTARDSLTAFTEEPSPQLIEPQTPFFKQTEKVQNILKTETQSMYVESKDKFQQPLMKRSLDLDQKVNNKASILSENAKKADSFYEGTNESLDELYKRQKQYLMCLHLYRQFQKSKAFDTIPLIRINQNKRKVAQPSSASVYKVEISHVLKTERNKTKESSQEKNIKRLSSSIQSNQNNFRDRSKKRYSQTLSQRTISTPDERVLHLQNHNNEVKRVNVTQKNKREQLIKKIIDLQVNLQLTLNILQTNVSESQAFQNIGRLGRMQTIVKAKMAVDGNQLYKLASKLKD